LFESRSAGESTETDKMSVTAVAQVRAEIGGGWSVLDGILFRAAKNEAVLALPGIGESLGQTECAHDTPGQGPPAIYETTRSSCWHPAGGQDSTQSS